MSKTRILLTGADCFIGSHILGLLLSGHNLSIQAMVRTRESAFTLQEQFTQITSSALEFRVSYQDDLVLPGRFDDALNVPNDPFQIVLHILTAVLPEEADCLTRFVNVESDAVSGFLDSVQRLAKQAHRVVLISSLAQFARWLQREETVHSVNQEYALATSQAGDNIIYDAVLKWISESRPHFDVVYITAPSLYGPATRPLETSSDVLEANRRIWDLCSNEYRERIDVPPYGIMNFVDVRDLALAVVRATFTAEAGDRRFLVSAGIMPAGVEIAQMLFTQFPELRGRIGVPGTSPQQASSRSSYLEPLDTSLAGSILGMTSYRSAEDTVIDTARQMLDLQQRKEWRRIIHS